MNFHSKWTLYFHSPVDQDWTIDSYKKIGVIENPSDYWKIMNELEGECIEGGMFFLMRGDLPPLWEAEENVKGGSLCFKIYKKFVNRVWIDLSIYLITHELMKNKELSHHLTGLTISPKKTFCIIKLWNDNASMNTSTYIRESIPYINLKDTLYKAHKSR
jgi:hypothetical protein